MRAYHAIALAFLATLAAATLFALGPVPPAGAREPIEWQAVDVGDQDVIAQKEALLDRLAPDLDPQSFHKLDPQMGVPTLDYGQYEDEIRADAETLEGNWRSGYEGAVDSFRVAQQKRSSLLILTEQIDNNLLLFRTELESARSKRDGFFHSLSALGRSDVVLFWQPLSADDMILSEEELAAKAEDLAKCALESNQSVQRVMRGFNVEADENYVRGATVTVTADDVVSLGSPPIFSFTGQGESPLLLYIQAYQVFPQYESHESAHGNPSALARDSESCSPQAQVVTDLESLPELEILQQNDTVRQRITDLLEQSRSINERLETKASQENETFMVQMRETKGRLSAAANNVEQGVKLLVEEIGGIAVRHAGPDTDFQTALRRAEEVYRRSSALLDTRLDAPILDNDLWDKDKKAREMERKKIEDELVMLTRQAETQLTGAIHTRSTILWQRENVVVQSGDLGDLAQRTVENMLEILAQRADHVRSYKVIKIDKSLTESTLMSVPGTEFYRPAMFEQIAFPKVRLHFQRSSEGRLTRSLEIFLAVRFLYEQYKGSSADDEVSFESPKGCEKKYLAEINSQSGPVRRSGDFVFHIAKDGRIIKLWYVASLTHPWPREALDDKIAEIPCFEGWRLPTVSELRDLVTGLRNSAEAPPDLPHGIWTSEKDPLGTDEWKIYFPQEDSYEFRGEASEWGLTVVTDRYAPATETAQSPEDPQ